MWFLFFPALADSPLPAEMHARFALLTEARLAVQNGDLPLAQARAKDLVALKPPHDLKSPWRPFVVELKKDAAILAEAPTRADAASKVVQIAITCAACHQEMKGGPSIPDLSSLTPDVQRIAAVDLLWLSLIKGSGSTWMRAAPLVDLQADLDEEGRAHAFAKLLTQDGPR